MKLSNVVAHMRQYCPTFENRIGIALSFKPEQGTVKLSVPAAVVLPGDDDADPSSFQNVVVQEVEDRFVVVLIVQTADRDRGEQTADVLHDLKAEVWRALIGWVPGDGYDVIEYVGGEVSEMTRALTYYTLTFRATLTIGSYAGLRPGDTPETWQEYELDGLPKLEGLDVQVDVIDPMADANLQKPGPDGRVEFELHEDVHL